MDFDVLIVVQAPTIVERLSTRDKDILFGKPSVQAEKEVLPDSQVAPTIIVEPEALPEITIAEIREGHQEVIAQSEELLERIRERTKGLVLKINRTTDYELFIAVNQLFESKTPITEITFDMYIKCLRYIKDIGLAMGEGI